MKISILLPFIKKGKNWDLERLNQKLKDQVTRDPRILAGNAMSAQALKHYVLFLLLNYLLLLRLLNCTQKHRPSSLTKKKKDILRIKIKVSSPNKLSEKLIKLRAVMDLILIQYFSHLQNFINKSFVELQYISRQSRNVLVEMSVRGLAPHPNLVSTQDSEEHIFRPLSYPKSLLTEKEGIPGQLKSFFSYSNTSINFDTTFVPTNDFQINRRYMFIDSTE